jgi:hypothetical protein
MEKTPEKTMLKCIDHEEECIMYCKDDRCMFPLMCTKCLEIHQKEYPNNSHEIESIDNIFESEDKKLEFAEEYTKQMEVIENETKDKQEVLKGAYSEFTTQVIQACHRYYVNNNIDNVLENLRNEFEMSKAEYQIQMNPDTLKKMAEDYLRLRKVDDAIKNNSKYIMTKDEIFQNIENELENLNGHVTNQLTKLETEYKKQLLNIVDYNIEKHLELLINQEEEDDLKEVENEFNETEQDNN